jgi:flavin reductase
METSPVEHTAHDLKSAFIAAMRRFAATVTIVTVCPKGERSGMTATAVASVSTDPPAVLVCVNRAASIRANLEIKTPFCINILATSHAAVSAAFGGKLTGAARFSVGNWDEDPEGRVFLKDAQANLFCVVDSTLDYGTHTVVIGKVDAIRLHGAVDPLLYANGKYIRMS